MFNTIEDEYFQKHLKKNVQIKMNCKTGFYSGNPLNKDTKSLDELKEKADNGDVEKLEKWLIKFKKFSKY